MSSILGIIDSILRNYKTEGITTLETLNKKLNKTRSRINEDAYRYVD
ncbi:hypothetical protein [Clostridium sp. OS1-26]|nr:hypothetical protein [Clostridium sp. OS1-26]WML36744.1 hypothetical protein RCG18_09015 [Clostridium sp. OS1-26]